MENGNLKIYHFHFPPPPPKDFTVFEVLPEILLEKIICNSSKDFRLNFKKWEIFRGGGVGKRKHKNFVVLTFKAHLGPLTQ